MEDLNRLVTEYMSTQAELQRLRQQLTEARRALTAQLEPLTQSATDLEHSICEYLQSQGLPGIRKGGVSVVLERQYKTMPREEKVRIALENVNDKTDLQMVAHQICQAMRKRAPSEEFHLRLRIFPTTK